MSGIVIVFGVSLVIGISTCVVGLNRGWSLVKTLLIGCAISITTTSALIATGAIQ